MLLNRIETLRKQSVPFDALCSYIENLQSIALAFSGGVDSTFLLALCQSLLVSNHFMALTVKTPYIPTWEVKEALDYAKTLGVRHRLIKMPTPPEVSKNTTLRCYLCKKLLFKSMQQVIEPLQKYILIDGSNYDDLDDYRPGMQALKELEVVSPLLDCKITKQQIRDWSKRLELHTWQKPAYACLLTRLPYDTVVNDVDLVQIERAETELFTLGFKAVRVRKHDDLARIEICPNDFTNILKSRNVINQIFHDIGFKHITLDLQGYRLSGKKNL